MSELLALSFDAVTAPLISLKNVLARPDAGAMKGNPTGWGFGWYPAAELAGQGLWRSASRSNLKRPKASAGQIRMLMCPQPIGNRSYGSIAAAYATAVWRFPGTT